MKLNIGCGDVRIPGYTGVDAVQRGAADLIIDAFHLGDAFSEGTITEIIAIHFWEHVWLGEIELISSIFYRLLVPGGSLTLELPCWDKIILNGYNDIRRKKWRPRSHVYGMNGDPSAHTTKDVWMLHKYTWSKMEISEKLKSMGWVNVEVGEAVYHYPDRDMRVTCQTKK